MCCENRLPLIGEKAPAFKAETTQGSIKRLLIAMQMSDQHKVATPADWQPGEEVIVPPPGLCGSAKERVDTPASNTRVLDWFMTMRKCPK